MSSDKDSTDNVTFQDRREQESTSLQKKPIERTSINRSCQISSRLQIEPKPITNAQRTGTFDQFSSIINILPFSEEP